MKFRLTVNAAIFNKDGEVLLCKMPKNQGVYPGQWALPGGGMEEDEQMLDALKREIKEEVGLDVTDIVPIHFQDDERIKLLRNGGEEAVYMIHLVFQAKADSNSVTINDEFEDYAWVGKRDLTKYDLNRATINTFTQLGWI